MISPEAESASIEEWSLRTLRGYKEKRLESLYERYLKAYEVEKAYIESIPFDEEACLKYEEQERKVEEARKEKRRKDAALRREVKAMFKEKYPGLSMSDPHVVNMFLAFEQEEIYRRRSCELKLAVRERLLNTEPK